MLVVGLLQPLQRQLPHIPLRTCADTPDRDADIEDDAGDDADSTVSACTCERHCRDWRTTVYRLHAVLRTDSRLGPDADADPAVLCSSRKRMSNRLRPQQQLLCTMNRCWVGVVVAGVGGGDVVAVVADAVAAAAAVVHPNSIGLAAAAN